MKPRDQTAGPSCADANSAVAMTSSSISAGAQQPPSVPLLQQQTRRHIERPIRVWPFAMECLAETDTEADSTETTVERTEGSLGDSSSVKTTTSTPHQPAASTAKKDSQNKNKAGSNSNQSQQDSAGTIKSVAGAESVGCTPFFGVKHYLNNFYGLPDDNTSAKIWSQMEAVSRQDLLLFFIGFAKIH